MKQQRVQRLRSATCTEPTCGQTFMTSRRHADKCSAKCRMRAHRRKAQQPKPVPLPEGSILLKTPVARPGYVARLVDGVWYDCPGAGSKRRVWVGACYKDQQWSVHSGQWVSSGYGHGLGCPHKPGTFNEGGES